MSDMDKDIELEVEKVEEQGVEVVESQPVNDSDYFKNILSVTGGGSIDDLMGNTVAVGFANAYYKLLEDGKSPKEAITELLFGDRFSKKAKTSEDEPKKGRFGRRGKKATKESEPTKESEGAEQEKGENGGIQQNSGLNSLLYILSLYGSDFNGVLTHDPDRIAKLVADKIEEQGGIDKVSIWGVARAVLWPSKVKDEVEAEQSQENDASQVGALEQDSQSTEKVVSDGTIGDRFAKSDPSSLPLRFHWGKKLVDNENNHADMKMPADAMDVDSSSADGADSGMDDDGMGPNN